MPPVKYSSNSNTSSRLHFALRSMAAQRANLLCAALTRLCRGRDTHAASVSLRAVRNQNHTRLLWIDEFTRQGGSLGIIHPSVADVIVGRLFTQLRAWRERCEKHAVQAHSVAAIGGGAR